MLRAKTFVAAALASSMIAGMAQADTVLIDWSTTRVVSNPDTHGNYWNSIGGSGHGDVTVDDLISTTNTATPWDVTAMQTYSGGGAGTAGWGGTGVNGPTGPAPFDQVNAVVDGIFVHNGGLFTITFSGLTSNTTYDLSMIGGRDDSGIDGVIAITTGTGSGGTLLNDGTLLNLSITSDASGQIAFTFQSSDTNSGLTADFNAMSIAPTAVTIPTPAALPAGLGLLTLAGLGRRRR